MDLSDLALLVVREDTSSSVWKKAAELSGIQYMLNITDKVLLTGSHYINPKGDNADIDVLVLVQNTKSYLFKTGTVLGEQDEYDLNLVSLRFGDVNLIIVQNRKVFSRWCIATKLATQMVLETKQQRKLLFRHICRD